MQHHIETIATGSGAQTDTEVIAAPGARKAIKVYGVYITSDTAMTVSLESGTSTLKHRQFVAANGGSLPVFPPERQALWECDPGAALTYTTSAAGNVAIEVWYDIAGA